jgi:hypothetical protein
MKLKRTKMGFHIIHTNFHENTPIVSEVITGMSTGCMATRMRYLQNKESGLKHGRQYYPLPLQQYLAM